MPALFILIMSMALRDTFGSERALFRYVIIDQEQSATSRKIADALQQSTMFQEYEWATADSGQLQQALSSDLHFAVTIPAGFTEHFTFDSPFKGLRLDVARDTREETLALFQGELAAILMGLRLEAIGKELEPLLGQNRGGLEVERYNHQKSIEVHYSGMNKGRTPTSTQQSVPSWIVFGMFFIIIPMSTVFINERKQNTLMRMHTMNISIPALFGGKIIPYLVINQIQVWLMVGVGVFIVPLLGADALTPGDSMAGLIMISSGLSFAAIGTSMLIAVTAGTVEQATTVGGIINILLGAIGGVMVPKLFMPPAMQTIANISPMSWGLEGFLDIFLRDLGPKDVFPEMLALTLFGLSLLLLAWLLFDQKVKRGM